MKEHKRVVYCIQNFNFTYNKILKMRRTYICNFVGSNMSYDESSYSHHVVSLDDRFSTEYPECFKLALYVLCRDEIRGMNGERPMCLSELIDQISDSDDTKKSEEGFWMSRVLEECGDVSRMSDVITRICQSERHTSKSVALQNMVHVTVVVYPETTVSIGNNEYVLSPDIICMNRLL